MKKLFFSIVLVVLSFGIAQSQSIKFNVRVGTSINHPELSSFNQGLFPIQLMSMMFTDEEEFFFEDNNNTLSIGDLSTYKPKQGFIFGGSMMCESQRGDAIEILIDYKKNNGSLSVNKSADESKIQLNGKYTIGSTSFGVRLYPKKTISNFRPFLLTGFSVHNITLSNNLVATRSYNYGWEDDEGNEYEQRGTTESDYESRFEDNKYSLELGFGLSYKIFKRYSLVLEGVYSFARKDKVVVPGKITIFDEGFEPDETLSIENVMKPDLSGAHLNLSLQIEL